MRAREFIDHALRQFIPPDAPPFHTRVLKGFYLTKSTDELREAHGLVELFDGSEVGIGVFEYNTGLGVKGLGMEWLSFDGSFALQEGQWVRLEGTCAESLPP